MEILSYDGENLSAFGDVVVVSLNHRLNVLGYLDLSQYGEQYKHSSQAGLADLVAALKWVHENIENFGGDPENVTIFGQSGGGSKVISLTQTPAADGLFHRAIMESGGASGDGGPKAVEQNRANQPRGRGLDLEVLGHPGKRGIPDRGRGLVRPGPGHHERHLHPEPRGQAHGLGSLARWGVLSGPPPGLRLRKESLHIPMLMGSVLGEFSGNFDRKIGDSIKNKWDEATLDQHLTEFFGDKKEEMVRLFREAYPERNLADVLFLDTGLRAGS